MATLAIQASLFGTLFVPNNDRKKYQFVDFRMGRFSINNRRIDLTRHVQIWYTDRIVSSFHLVNFLCSLKPNWRFYTIFNFFNIRLWTCIDFRALILQLPRNITISSKTYSIDFHQKLSRGSDLTRFWLFWSISKKLFNPSKHGGIELKFGMGLDLNCTMVGVKFGGDRSNLLRVIGFWSCWHFIEGMVFYAQHAFFVLIIDKKCHRTTRLSF